MRKEEQTLLAFERFLESIPLDRYRKELMPVKTVEQDLPPDLNPLPAVYKAFWAEETIQFPNYEEFFESWWKEHLKPLDDFIRRYFWGCSHEFVFLGFKARLYRTLVSVLTQFHFGYSWRAYCTLPFEASAELDMKGVDGLVHCGSVPVALQVKKETYRPEARGSSRFAQRRKYAHWILEVPYTIAPPEEIRLNVDRAKTPETRARHTLRLFLAERFQRRLSNGFIVFQPEYPRLVERLIQARVAQKDDRDIRWDEMLGILQEMTANAGAGL
ncbi:MAG: TaqI family restriction endonuclease [Anaerolineae bacterium]|nr:TaqI family restriction endonuclease [Anaerolineae bacterium]